MSHKTTAETYFAAWNARDADAILATLGEGGTYQDPSTGGPISGEALRGYVTAIWNVFPDLGFEIASHSDDGASAQWIMRGTNHGSYHGLPPTGRQVELPGADFFTFDASGRIASVTGYFDGGVIPRQLGLDIIVQPSEIGPFRFGTSTAVSTGKRDEPAAFSVTYLQARDDESVEEVRNRSREALTEMLGMEAFIGATTAKLGHRLVTITAWNDPDAPRRLMREGAHGEAMKFFYDGSLASAGYTSVWTLHRNNGFWVRCNACGTMARNAADGEACRDCGEVLPDRPAYW
ncbi:ester cyclase [Ovoidimarina sediminis]|uniref:ester cyclase n=1 Tax=Ovoidimarina sediminis TaxID=3079856 RepID=UPI00290FF958|nr:nuclear transport factor 2 family protein [Rhodophyticola sp. MJ-SS7]MDU8942395.1 nuclear transport factor 2 family protein [Rhodophyticola sp. MJ-SS7]